MGDKIYLRTTHSVSAGHPHVYLQQKMVSQWQNRIDVFTSLVSFIAKRQ